MKTLKRIIEAMPAIWGGLCMVWELGLVLILCYKAHLMNNVHETLAQDRIEMWFALALAWLIGRNINRPTLK